ncbi:MAG: hypothetical protein AAFO80_08250 [Pseudomonadota bacterium]
MTDPRRSNDGATYWKRVKRPRERDPDYDPFWDRETTNPYHRDDLPDDDLYGDDE